MALTNSCLELEMIPSKKMVRTLKEFINSSQIGEDVGSFPDADTMLRNLLSDMRQ
jgi:hypothetical protein